MLLQGSSSCFLSHPQQLQRSPRHHLNDFHSEGGREGISQDITLFPGVNLSLSLDSRKFCASLNCFFSVCLALFSGFGVTPGHTQGVIPGSVLEDHSSWCFGYPRGCQESTWTSHMQGKHPPCLPTPRLVPTALTISAKFNTVSPRPMSREHSMSCPGLCMLS